METNFFRPSNICQQKIVDYSHYLIGLLVFLCTAPSLIAGAEYLRLEVQYENDFHSETLSIDIDMESNKWYMELLGEPNLAIKTAWNADGTILQLGPRPDPLVLHVSDHDNGYPLHLFSPMRFGWIVYVAGDYLRRNDGQHVILPRGEVRVDVDILASRANVEWESEKHISASRLVFTFDEELVERTSEYLSIEPVGNNPTLITRGKIHDDLLDSYSNGERMAELRVDQWLEFNGSYIPKTWVYEEFDSAGNVWRFTRGETVAVETVSEIRVGNVPDSITVSDRRFRSQENNLNLISYTIDDGVVPSVDDESLIAMVQPIPGERATIEFGTYEPEPKRSKAPIIIVLVSVAILPPVLLLIIKHLQTK